MSLLRGKFDFVKKLGTSIIGKKPVLDAEKIAALHNDLALGQRLERLLESEGYQRGLRVILKRRHNQGISRLRQGQHGTALDELDRIDLDITEAIRLGKLANQILTKIKQENVYGRTSKHHPGRATA